MPLHDSHFEKSKENLITLKQLSSHKESKDWFITIAFYSALHLVEAMLSLQNRLKSNTLHCFSHTIRKDVLSAAYPKIWKKYRPLYDASLAARYIQRDDLQKDAFYSLDTIINTLIKQYYSSVLKQVKTIVGDNSKLTDIETVFRDCLSELDSITRRPQR